MFCKTFIWIQIWIITDNFPFISKIDVTIYV